MIAERERIDKEIAETKPRLEQIEKKLSASAKTRVQLYRQSKSLDNEIIPLAQQKEALKEDVATAERGMAWAQEDWENLKVLITEARSAGIAPKPVEEFSAADTSEKNAVPDHTEMTTHEASATQPAAIDP